MKVYIHLEDKKDLCSARNVDVKYKCSQGEDYKHLMEDINIFVL